MNQTCSLLKQSERREAQTPFIVLKSHGVTYFIVTAFYSYKSCSKLADSSYAEL